MITKLVNNRLFMCIRRIYAQVSQPGTGGLVRHGDWRVVYPDNEKTHYMSHGDAMQLKNVFGGRLEWRLDSRADDSEVAK